MLLGMIWMVGLSLVAPGPLLMAQDDGSVSGEQGNVVDEVPEDGPQESSEATPAIESGPSDAAATGGGTSSPPPASAAPQAPLQSGESSSSSSSSQGDAAMPPTSGEGSSGSPQTPDSGSIGAPLDTGAQVPILDGGTSEQPPTAIDPGVPQAPLHGSGEGGTNPIAYVMGGFGGVLVLFVLFTFYRRKKTWDEISDAMKIDGGDLPMTSQPPSQFNTQDIAGISNTQVSQPISEIKD